jgi:hypothetical protein
MVVYAGASWMLRLEEFRPLLRMFGGRLRRAA